MLETFPLVARAVISLMFASLAAASAGEPSAVANSATIFDAKRMEQIDGLIRQRMKSASIPGAAVALIEKGEVVLVRGYGVMKEDGQTVTRETRFAVGSISKSFTAAAVHSLADDGLLDLAAPAAQYFEQTSAQSDVSKVAGVTISRLLNHTSGYSTHSGNGNQSDRSHSPGVMRESALTLLERGPDGPPGESWQYSNANYQILGALIETVAKNSFRETVAQRVIALAQLESAEVLLARTSLDAVGHQFAFGLRLERSTVPGGVIAAQGGVVASIDDLARYLLWQMNQLDAAAWQQRYEAAATVGGDVRYGHGWFMTPSKVGLIVYHDGTNPGFTAAAAFNPISETAVVVVTNASSGYVGNDVDALTVGVRQLAMSIAVTGGRNFSSAIAQMVGLTLLVLLIALWAIAFVRFPAKRANSWLGIALPSVGLLLLAWLLGVVLPNSLGATLNATQAFYPDAGIVLTSVVLACSGWAVVRLLCLLWFRMRSAQSG